jgi:hypothetical protein
MKNILPDLESAYKILNTISSMYNQTLGAMQNCEEEENDIRHAFELCDLKYEDRAKLATRQSVVLKERRKYKDMLNVMEPLHGLMQESTSIDFMKRLSIILGETRKVDKKRGYRCYRNRTSVVKDVLNRDVQDSTGTEG